MKSNIFYQDNQSAILLEKNGRSSSGEKSRHIIIRYFLIKDVFQRDKIMVTYCPTEELFTIVKDTIMGVTPYHSKERVKNKIYSVLIK